MQYAAILFAYKLYQKKLAILIIRNTRQLHGTTAIPEFRIPYMQYLIMRIFRTRFLNLKIVIEFSTLVKIVLTSYARLRTKRRCFQLVITYYFACEISNNRRPKKAVGTRRAGKLPIIICRIFFLIRFLFAIVPATRVICQYLAIFCEIEGGGMNIIRILKYDIYASSLSRKWPFIPRA